MRLFSYIQHLLSLVAELFAPYKLTSLRNKLFQLFLLRLHKPGSPLSASPISQANSLEGTSWVVVNDVWFASTSLISDWKLAIQKREKNFMELREYAELPLCRHIVL